MPLNVINGAFWSKRIEALAISRRDNGNEELSVNKHMIAESLAITKLIGYGAIRRLHNRSFAGIEHLIAETLADLKVKPIAPNVFIEDGGIWSTWRASNFMKVQLTLSGKA